VNVKVKVNDLEGGREREREEEGKSPMVLWSLES
jgi:hypothetical protein